MSGIKHLGDPVLRPRGSVGDERRPMLRGARPPHCGMNRFRVEWKARDGSCVLVSPVTLLVSTLTSQRTGPMRRSGWVNRHLCARAAQGCEGALSTGEHENLLVTGRTMERVKHGFDAVIIRMDKSIVQDHRDGAP